MWTSNNALIPDPDKEDILASKPTDWPFLHLGLRMCGWGDDMVKFYLLGTPLIWWGGTVSLLLSLVVGFWYLARMQRHYRDWKAGEWDQFLWVAKLALGGWGLHFCESPESFVWCLPTWIVPFLIMGRVTYLHHYVSLSASG